MDSLINSAESFIKMHPGTSVGIFYLYMYAGAVGSDELADALWFFRARGQVFNYMKRFCMLGVGLAMLVFPVWLWLMVAKFMQSSDATAMVNAWYVIGFGLAIYEWGEKLSDSIRNAPLRLQPVLVLTSAITLLFWMISFPLIGLGLIGCACIPRSTGGRQFDEFPSSSKNSL